MHLSFSINRFLRSSLYLASARVKVFVTRVWYRGTFTLSAVAGLLSPQDMLTFQLDGTRHLGPEERPVTV